MGRIRVRDTDRGTVRDRVRFRDIADLKLSILVPIQITDLNLTPCNIIIMTIIYILSSLSRATD